MAYHITILRTSDGQRTPIAREEFLLAARNCPDVRVNAGDSVAEVYTGSQLRAKLSWQDGEIWTNVPETEVIAVMLKIAAELRARVRGDELETYRTPNEAYFHPDDQLEADRAKRGTERLIGSTKRKQWMLHAMIFGIFLLLALLVAYISRR